MWPNVRRSWLRVGGVARAGFARAGGGHHWRALSAGADAKPPPRIIHSPNPPLVVPRVGLGHFLLDSIARHPSRIALVDGVSGVQTTYSQLERDILTLGHAMRHKVGLSEADVLCTYAPNCAHYATVFCAAFAIGVRCSLINHNYLENELAFHMRLMYSKAIMTVPPLLPIVLSAVQHASCIKSIILIDNFVSTDVNATPHQLPTDSDTHVRVYRLSDLLRGPDRLSGCVSVPEPERTVSCMPASSGTTGLPKGVSLSHSNVISAVLMLNHPNVFQLTEQHVLLGLLPFYHIYGQVIILYHALHAGACVVTLPKFEPALFSRTVSTFKVNRLHVAPPLALLLARYPDLNPADFTSVREVLSAAAPLSFGIIEEVQRRIPSIDCFIQAYGLTETTGASHMEPKRAPKPGSVGVLMPSMEARVVHVETGEDLPAGADGEIWMRGPSMMLGYWDNPGATRQATEEGWLKTGDIGSHDEEGYFYVVDRKKELIKYKGLQVAPAELEKALLAHPAVADCAVVGVPDERAGEVPRAFVVLKCQTPPDPNLVAAQLQRYIAETLADQKRLRGGVEFVAAIPKSPSGKILRRQLKLLTLQRAGSSS